MEKIELFNYKKIFFFYSSTFRCILNKSLIINNSTSKTNTKIHVGRIRYCNYEKNDLILFYKFICLKIKGPGVISS